MNIFFVNILFFRYSQNVSAAGWNVFAGRIWPADRSLVTPALNSIFKKHSYWERSQESLVRWTDFQLMRWVTHGKGNWWVTHGKGNWWVTHGKGNWWVTHGKGNSYIVVRGLECTRCDWRSKIYFSALCNSQTQTYGQFVVKSTKTNQVKDDNTTSWINWLSMTTMSTQCLVDAYGQGKNIDNFTSSRVKPLTFTLICKTLQTCFINLNEFVTRFLLPKPSPESRQQGGFTFVRGELTFKFDENSTNL